MSRHLLMACSIVLLATAPGFAQWCDGRNTGGIFQDNSSMGGPNLLLAMRYDAPLDIVVSRIEIFTGESTGTNTVGIWTHDPVNNSPIAAVATGSWSMSTINGWQGADLSAPVLLPSGTTWWVVWAPINGSQSNFQAPNTGTPVAYRGSFDGGNSWNGPFSDPVKFRLYCSAGWPGAFTTSLTANANGTVTLAVTGAPPAAFQGYTLISATVSQPVGTAPIFGIVVDALTLQIAFVLAPIAQPGNPLHWLATPGLFPEVPFTIPASAVTALAGLTWDFVTVTFDSGTLINGISTVQRITF